MMTQISMQCLTITRIYFLIILFIIISSLAATIINIPTDQPTIQAGIDIATEGDTILVSPGTYYENIEIFQKYDIHLIGSGSDVTTIDGNENGHVVVFNIASGRISNFTITNSGNDPIYSTGIYTSQSTVVIDSNVVTNNSFGIGASSTSEVFIHRNKIIYNSGYTTIKFSSSSGIVTYNLISDNNGYGIFNYYSSPDILNNTIVGNNESFALLLNPLEHQIVHNNILINFEIGILVQGGDQSAVPLLDISYNDVWNNSFANYWEEYNLYSQPFLPQPGTGEICEDPSFVDPLSGDYHLQSDSPCIDAGNPNSSYDPDGTIADIGAYYYNQNSGIEESILSYSNANLNNFPNPFNPTTSIRFDIKENDTGFLSIYNLKGQLIESQQFETGSHNFVWGASDLSSGLYLYKLEVNNKTVAVKKCLLLK